MNFILNNVLLDAVIKPSIVLLLTLGATRLLLGRSASLRHLVLATGLASALALPLIGLMIPSWQPRVAGLAMNSLSRIQQAPHSEASSRIPVAAVTTGSTSVALPTAVPAVSSRITPERVGIAVWICGMLVFAALLMVEVVKLARVAFRAETVYRQSWRDLALDISHQLRLKRSVRLIRNANASVLGTWGALRPRVLLPRESTEWSGERMRVVLGHELAHVKRNDWLVQIVAEAARTIYWFNPLFWAACAALRRESEHACDDSAMRLGADGPTYAAHVLDVVRTLNHSGEPGTAALAMAGTSNLERRLVAMLNPSLNRRVVTNGALAIVILIAGALTLPLAAMHSPAAAAVASTVSPAGRSEPLAQDVQAGGRTTAQLKEAVETRLQSSLASPVITVGGAKAFITPDPQRETPPPSQGQTETTDTSSALASFRAGVAAYYQNLAAQSAPGSISGLVSDASGARIPGVTVNATEASTGRIYRVLANDSGAFNLTPLPPGDYSMAISLQGFRTSAFSAIKVASGQNTSQNVTLSIGSLNTTVEVTVSAVGPVCFSVFGTVKADGTPFTQADCPGGIAISTARGVTQPAAAPSPVGAIVVLSPSTGEILNGPNPITANGQRTPIRLGGDVRPARLLTHPVPVYPAAARTGGIEGVVILSGMIATDGTIKSLQIINSSNSFLNESPIEAVQQWTYQPALLNGTPVESITTITVNFSFGR